MHSHMCVHPVSPGPSLTISFGAANHTYVSSHVAPALAVNIGPVLLAYVLFSSAYIYVENTLKKGIVPAVTSLCVLASLSPQGSWEAGLAGDMPWQFISKFPRASSSS